MKKSTIRLGHLGVMGLAAILALAVISCQSKVNVSHESLPLDKEDRTGKITVTAAKFDWQGLCEATWKRQDTDGSGVDVLYGIAPTLLEQTTDIVADLGKGFCLSYKLLGSPEGARVFYKVRWTFPRPLTPPGKTPLTEFLANVDTTIGQENHAGWRFGHEWELVPGQYQVEIIWEDKVVGSKEFKVTLSPAAQKIADKPGADAKKP